MKILLVVTLLVAAAVALDFYRTVKDKRSDMNFYGYAMGKRYSPNIIGDGLMKSKSKQFS